MIINDLDGYYIVFDTKNWNTELDTLIFRITKTNHKVQWSKLKVQISMLSGVMEMIARCGVSL